MLLADRSGGKPGILESWSEPSDLPYQEEQEALVVSRYGELDHAGTINLRPERWDLPELFHRVLKRSLRVR
jgi:hypothetical protein